MPGPWQSRERSGLPVLPGVATATEVQAAYNLGLRIVKYFPAGLLGGPPALRALAEAFRDMRFMPTGGVREADLSRVSGHGLRSSPAAAAGLRHRS